MDVGAAVKFKVMFNSVVEVTVNVHEMAVLGRVEQTRASRN